MKRNFQKTMLGLLVFSVLVNGILNLDVSTVRATDEPEKQTVAVSGCFTASSGFSDIQYHKFMSYLTQEYAPELRTAWEEALIERESIKPQLSLEKTGIVTSGQEKGLMITCTQPAKDFPGVRTFEIKPGVAEDAVINIEFAEDQESEIYITQLNLQNELDQAIVNNDGQAIKTVLGKMLSNYQDITEDIKSQLSKIDINNQ